MLELRQLIGQAARLGGGDLCAIGHDWQSVGGRGCECTASINHSQPVFQCARCGDIDYGERGGPGFADCTRQCGNLGPEHYQWRF